jgi:hypothetical protein
VCECKAGRAGLQAAPRSVAQLIEELCNKIKIKNLASLARVTPGGTEREEMNKQLSYILARRPRCWDKPIRGTLIARRVAPLARSLKLHSSEWLYYICRLCPQVLPFHVHIAMFTEVCQDACVSLNSLNLHKPRTVWTTPVIMFQGCYQ